MRQKSVLFLTLGLSVFAAAIWFAVQKTEGPEILPEQEEDGQQLVFAVFGDNEGTGPVLDAIIEQINARNPDFIVNVADLTSHAETGEFAQVAEAFRRFRAPVYTVVGNNDILGDSARTLWRGAFGQERWYSFTAGDAHFVFLDNADRRVGFPEEELSWLRADLAASTAKETFLFFHRPFGLPLEDIVGDDETPASRASNEEFREILRTAAVSHIYTGHVHTYLPFTLEGIPATVTGGGGALPQRLLGGEASAFYHFLIVTVGQDGIQQELVPITSAQPSLPRK